MPLVTSPDDEHGRQLVADHPLLHPLDDDDRDHVVAAVEVHRLAAGDVLIEVGDPPGPLVLVLEGAAVVTRDGREVGHVTAGSWVGELSLLEDRPDRARVAAIHEMLVAVVRGADVDRMLSLDPIARQIDSIARRRRAANRSAEVEPVETTMPDGGALWLRPLVSADWQLFAAGDGRVSEQSLRMRFFSAPPRTESRFRQLTDVDLRTAFAWAAFVDDLIVGVGRHGLQVEDHDTAELAVLVADAHQRRGIGRVLIEGAIAAAAAHGARQLLAVAREENDPIQRMLGRLGADFVPGTVEGIVQARWPVDDALGRVEDPALCARLRSVAETVLEPVQGR